jgi:sec-independent protein translocase protein TatA
VGRNLFDNPLLLVVLVLVIVVVFGAKRLPDAARSLGRSMRIFKSEVKEMKDDGKSSGSGTGAQPLEGRVVDGTDRTERVDGAGGADGAGSADGARAEQPVEQHAERSDQRHGA